MEPSGWHTESSREKKGEQNPCISHSKEDVFPYCEIILQIDSLSCQLLAKCKRHLIYLIMVNCSIFFFSFLMKESIFMALIFYDWKSRIYLSISPMEFDISLFLRYFTHRTYSNASVFSPAEHHSQVTEHRTDHQSVYREHTVSTKPQLCTIQ